ncbi:MAG: tRNA preQ1(34) S-adenosylmethionine ribosyltransferase-isomerase QueA [Dehalococcoidia bacterium]|nr:tRNA preQ1(34) S-adenosylmethionine ribosyltransferase-isomerase QueA [Dehalococcoidia bacterium]
MRTADFDYQLPRELIAQTPVEPRDRSRLLMMDRTRDVLAHRLFHELPSLLRSGDLLVLNDSRVIPARLHGRRADTCGQVELLLLRREAPGVWQCLGRPGRGLRPGARIVFDQGLEARVIDAYADGLRLVELNDEALVERVGHVPLPPYIHTPLGDPERYQTIYAGHTEDKKGSAAAPTAGLHFTPELMERLGGAGVEMAFVTLHVGLDTFRPVDEDDPREHKLHTEFWQVEPDAAAAVNLAKREGRRIVAVGTTSVRVLEQAALLAEQQGHTDKLAYEHKDIQAGAGWADLFILPGHRFRLVDALLTNFHLPRSSLLMLVSAFAGRERVLAAYAEAIRERYRFYSFGDAMLLV